MNRNSSRRRGGTREALLEAAFKLLDADKSFDSLSLREVTREVGIVPTAFYRHFPVMEALGLALVDDSFKVFRQIQDAVRKETANTDKLISGIVRAWITQTRVHRSRFRFVARERFGGSAAVRDAIRRELRLYQAELAVDLARFPLLRDWSNADLHMLAALFMNTMMAIAEELLDRLPNDRGAEKELTALARKQLRLILLGMPHWRSDG